MPTTGLAAWSHDGELQALARGNRVDVRRVEGGDLLASREFDGPVRADWSPQNRELLVRTPEHMWLWRPDPDASPHELAKRFHWSAWSPDGREIAYADWGDRVWFLDVASGAKVELPLPSGGRPFCGAWSPDGTRMVIGRLDPVLQIVDRAARTVTKTLRAHIARVIAVAWSPDGNRIASGSWDRTVRVWDAASGLELLALRHAANVGAVAWDARGERLATLTEDGCLRVWSTDAAQRR